MPVSLRLTSLILLIGQVLTPAASARLDPFAPVSPGRVILPTSPANPASSRSQGSPPLPPPNAFKTARPAGVASPGPVSSLDHYQLEALLTENGRLRILLSDQKTGELISTSLGARLPGTGITVTAANQGSNPSVTLSQGGASRRLGL